MFDEQLVSEIDKSMRSEYDFSNAIRGKHHKALDKGYSVHIHQSDGTTVIEYYKLADGTVMLQSDVREYFPDSEAVNSALRSLIALMSKMPNRCRSVEQAYRK